MDLATYLFYGCLVLGLYSYFLYPLLLLAVPARNRQAVPAGGELPRLSLIVTAHNEQERIRDKLENSLALDYPADRLEIIVASDCSTDATDAIVQSLAARGVRLVRAGERKGKEYAQWCALQAARGDIMVFSDAATRIPADALRRLARRFDDPAIGAVSSEDRFISQDGRLAGEGAYVRYEMWLRRLESARAGLVGLSGSFFAARHELCADWDIHSPSDFNTALNCAKAGRYAVTCPEVVGIYGDVQDPALEYRRKLRTVIRGITAVARHPEVLNPLRLGFFACQVWSHKILRWGVPWFMLGFAIATMLLIDAGPVYRGAAAAQVLFYLVALGGFLSARSRDNALVRIVFFFVQTNLALAHAALLFLLGRRMTVWTPSKR